MNTANVGERESPHERNGRDSNPRAFRPPAFKAGAIVRSATVPGPRVAALDDTGLTSMP